jgi:multiple sugar transport system permease protein
MHVSQPLGEKPQESMKNQLGFARDSMYKSDLLDKLSLFFVWQIGKDREDEFRMTRIARQEMMAGIIFVLPTLIIYLIIVVIPIIATFSLSFFEYSIIKQSAWAGFDNFLRLFQDLRMRRVLFNSVLFSILSVCGNVSGGVFLAILLNRKMPRLFSSFFRSVYFLPVVIGYVYVSIVWGNLYATDTGIFNYYLGKIGVNKIGWLTNGNIVMFAIVIMDIWKSVGFFMVISIAGLQNIPIQIYEAAKIDGASSVQTTFRITLPLLSPTIFYNIIWCMINALQVFDAVYILTQGGPGDASRSMVVYIYETAFQKFDMGYASAMAILLFLVIGVLTAFQFRLSSKWVYY